MSRISKIVASVAFASWSNLLCASLAHGQVRGDFDGDGFADLAFSAAFEDIDEVTDAGAVHVIYGSANGLTAQGSQFFNQNTPGVSNEAEFGDGFGEELAAGDFNGDGFDDLAIGVPHENVNSMDDAGAVHIIYGSANGLTFGNDDFWTQDSPGIKNIAEPDDQFGSALIGGDFDGDGIDDLAIGVPLENLGGLVDAGIVHALYGSPSGLTATGDQVWHQDQPNVDGVAELDDMFGHTLQSGDFDNDGRDDLAIGVPGQSVNSAAQAGAVQVLYGANSGLHANDAQLWHQNQPGIANSAEPEDRFGTTLASGDFDGDSFDDLAIGAPNEDMNGLIDSGVVHVLYGSNIRLRGGNSQMWHQDSTDITDNAEANELFGASLAAGDFNNNGRDDLAIGVPGEDVGDALDGGAINVLYGRINGLSALGDQFWNQDQPGVLDESESDDGFGASLTTGDFNNDNKDDLAIGVGGEDVGLVADAGAVNVLYGTAASKLTGGQDEFWHQNVPGIADEAESSDAVGFSLGR